MKPVRLEADGFTCYRDRQAPLEFSGMSLFAIAGPTGAGKSSILDAMLFALYGEVPRIGKQGIGEFIAHGRDRMAVTLDFTVRGALYRVARQVKRGRKSGLTTTALLEELAPGDAPPRSLAENVKPVNDAVEQLLGLDFESFTQTVILPQGEFAKFLRSDPKDQRAILQHLLRHDIFTRMREDAERRRLELAGELGGVERELKAFALATPEALQQQRLALAAIQQRLGELARDEAASEQQLRELRARRALTEEVRQLRQRRTAFAEQAAQLEALRAELDAARRAARVVPRHAAHEQAIAIRLKAAQAHADAESAFTAAAAAVATAETEVRATTDEAATLPALALRIQAIDEIKGDLLRRDALQRQATELAARLPVLKKQVVSTARELERARQQEAAAQQAAVAAGQAVQQIGYDPEMHRRVEALMALATRVRALDDELAALQALSTRRHADLERADAAAADAMRRLEQAERDWQSAVDAETQANQRYDRALDQHRAAHLRDQLHPGERCPVCEQLVASVPSSEQVPALDALKRARTAATEAVQRAQRNRQLVAEQRAGLLATRDNVRVTCDEAAASVREKATQRRQRLVEMATTAGVSPRPAVASASASASASRSASTSAMARAATSAPAGSVLPLFDVADAGSDPRADQRDDQRDDNDRATHRVDEDAADMVSAGEQLLAHIDVRHREQTTARDRSAEATVRRQQAESDLAKQALVLAHAGAAARSAADEDARVRVEAAAAEEELARIVARITAVSSDADPAGERSRLAARVRQLEEARHDAQQRFAEVQRTHAAAQERLSTQNAALLAARDHEASAGEALTRELADNGFAAAVQALAAVRDLATQQALDAQTRSFESERSAALGRLADLEPQLAGRELSADELLAAETAHEQLFAAWRAADLEASVLASGCERLAADVARRTALVVEQERVQRRLATHAEMAADLKGDAFQEYMLQEAFHALVAGASLRLRQMSNRYTLEWEAGDFFVVDHDNAGERRRAETLSGGETFMASLCLALQLSDEVLRTSGALQMDSLFIDEGFGTLDADSLSEVTDAMEALREDGSRLIGVISHRPELTDRLPGCIRVVKGAGESSWRLERVG